MAHHHHGDGESYYLDQLATIFVAAALAGASIVLYLGYQTWDGKYDILSLILANKFDVFLLWSGIALAALVLIRAISLWKTAGQTNHEHEHLHEHTHDHGDCCHDHHDHGPGHHHHHDHGHAHEHEHVHAHALAKSSGPYEEGIQPQAHAHGMTHASALPQQLQQPATVSLPVHSHGASCGHDHDHGWQPWRYMILMFPLLIFFLRLPNKPPRVSGMDLDMVGDPTEEAANLASAVGAGNSPLQPLVLLSGTIFQPVQNVDFKTLEGAAADEAGRKDWKGRMVRVKGQFMPKSDNERQFTLIRLKIQCCAADLIQLKVPMLCRDSVSDITPEQWVDVIGRVDFQQVGPNNFVTVLLVPARKNVDDQATPDYDPYIQ